jgi:hypothetical protein
VNPESPGGAPNEIVGGTAAALLAEHHRWEEDLSIFRTWKTGEQALKKNITAFEQMYLEILNNDMVGLGSLRHLQDTCLTTSFSPMVASLMLTLSTTGKMCVKHGTHINMWSPYSSRFRIALITQNEGGGVAIGEAHKL